MADDYKFKTRLVQLKFSECITAAGTHYKLIISVILTVV